MKTHPNHTIYSPPFGMLVQERVFTAAEYRFGFQGQEKDDEISGDGNSNTAEYWQYDSRLGRRWNVDPIDFEWLSPYSAFRNNPIKYVDIKGDTWDPENGSDKKAEMHKVYVNNKMNQYGDEITTNNSKINSLKAELNKVNEDKERQYPLQTMTTDGNRLAVEASNIQDKINSIERKNAELSSMIDILSVYLNTLNQLEISPVVYSLIVTNGQPRAVAPSNSRVEILFDGSNENLAHELTHGGQFESRNEALPSYSYNAFSPTWDIYDEIEAFSIQQALQPGLFGSLSNVTATSIRAKYPVYHEAPDVRLNTETTISQAAFYYSKAVIILKQGGTGNLTIRQYKTVHSNYDFNIKQ